MRVLTGLQPSGKLHVGNYLGAIRPMLDQQANSELYCFIANMHSLTTVFDKDVLIENTNDALLDLLALGMDPEKSVLWIQSDVPEVAELTWYLNCMTPIGLLQRCTSFKDKSDRGIPASNGLFAYPVLMAADILLFDSEAVPVGKDQKQHLEVTRDIAIKFNNHYGETFVIPEPQIQQELATIPGTDGQKMSKSYDNTLELFAPKKKFRKKVMSIVTDSTPVEDPKEPEGNNVYELYKFFASKEDVQEMADKFRAGGFGYGDAKKALFEVLMEHFGEYRDKREELVKNGDYINEVRKKGAERARNTASGVLSRVRKAIGIV